MLSQSLKPCPVLFLLQDLQALFVCDPPCAGHVPIYAHTSFLWKLYAAEVLYLKHEYVPSELRLDLLSIQPVFEAFFLLKFKQ